MDAREKRASCQKKRDKKERGGREREIGERRRRRGATRTKDSGEAHFSMHGCNLNAVRTRM